MKKFTVAGVALVLAGAWLLPASRGTTNPHEQGKAGPAKAVCVMTPLSGSKVSGLIYFTQVGDAVEITGKITGLTPGLHGFHVHQYGDMTKDDGMATGGHFNPEGKKHGSPHGDERHVGDLGNVTADKDGVAVLNVKDKVIQLHGPHSILGRGLIVHAKADDEKTDPTGDAGGRVAGGVIGIAFVAPKK